MGTCRNSEPECTFTQNNECCFDCSQREKCFYKCDYCKKNKENRCKYYSENQKL